MKGQKFDRRAFNEFVLLKSLTSPSLIPLFLFIVYWAKHDNLENENVSPPDLEQLSDKHDSDHAQTCYTDSPQGTSLVYKSAG